jgi:hypothetical protein
VFERFTDRARRVVVLAQEESRLLNHNYIGTEHLLLGLIHESDGVAARVLESLSISLADVRSEVEAIVGTGGSAPAGHIPFTPRAKKVLELSLREALLLGHTYIGTEHILLGLLREGEGVAAQVLAKLGVDLPVARQRVIQVLSGYAGGASPDEPGGSAERGTTSRTVLSGFSRPREWHAPQCSFCRRDLTEVRRYATGTGAAICGDCITAAHAALADATGDQRIVVLPPRVVGTPPPDDPTAADKIAAAFRAVFGASGSAAAGDLEHGGDLMGRFRQALRDNPDLQIGEVRVIEVRFITPDLPDVRFVLQDDDHPFVGSAVRSGDRWLVSAHTILGVLGGLGIDLPPEA